MAREKSEDTKARQEQAEKQAKEKNPCLCGCGGVPKGGRYLPGHDSKHKSAQLKAEREAAKAASEKAKA